MNEKIVLEDIGDTLREVNAHQKVVEKQVRESGEKFAKDLFDFASSLVRMQGGGYSGSREKRG